MSSSDYYAVLDVGPSASQDDIRTAYYRQVRRHPPEKDQEGFQRVQQAYDVLSNPETRAEYDEQRRTDPETQRLVEEGRELLEESDPDALIPLKRALVRQPESLYIRDLFVQALVVGEDYDNAEKQARVLIAAAPENPAYHTRLGDILRIDDRDDEAEGPFRKALELDQETPQPVIKLAYLLDYLDRGDEAVRLLRRAIVRDGRVDFEDFLFFQVLCRIFINADDSNRLTEIHTEIRKILPPDPETRSFVAWFYYQDAMMLAAAKNFSAALAMIDEAAGIDDSLPELSEMRQRIKDSKIALDEINRLHDDEEILHALRYAVGSLVLMRVLDLRDDFEKTFDQAVEGLTFHLTLDGSPLLNHIGLVRSRYPAVSSVIGDFLERVEESYRSSQNAHMTVRCPSCGKQGYTEFPTVKNLVETGRMNVAQALNLLRDHGTEYAKKYLVFTCDKCSTDFNGQSERLSRPQVPAGSRAGESVSSENLRLLGCLALTVLVIVVLLVSIGDDSTQSVAGRSSALPTPLASTTAGRPAQPPASKSSWTMHVTGEALNVREQPGVEFNRIVRLSRFDTVELLSSSGDGWGKVRIPGGATGYVAVKYLGKGPGDAAKRAWCEANAGQRPKNGEVLHQKSTGPHTLKIRNAPGNDAVVKLKDRYDQTVVSLFIRSGQTASVDSVPEGSFEVIYASGDGYSRACGYFMDGLSVTKADTIASFYRTEDAYYTYTAINEFTLYRVEGGNLSTKGATLDEFLDE